MVQKIAFFLGIGMIVVTMAGLAAAEAPVMPFSNDTSVQSLGDPELGLSSSGSWQAREPVETGAMPAKPGDSTDSCCASNGVPAVDEHGSTVIRQGIDDGP